jgi:hypothetical protein
MGIKSVGFLNTRTLSEIKATIIPLGRGIFRMDVKDKQQLLFENLKRIKDYWTDVSVSRMNKDANLKLSNSEVSIKILQQLISTPEELNALREFQNDIIEGVLHSLMVMFDVGDRLADHIKVDIIDRVTKESLQGNIAFHEEFISYLLDKEEKKQI